MHCSDSKYISANRKLFLFAFPHRALIFILLKQPLYNKDDFFDTLSCNALDHDFQNGRTRFSEQLKIDTEVIHIYIHRFLTFEKFVDSTYCGCLFNLCRLLGTFKGIGEVGVAVGLHVVAVPMDLITEGDMAMAMAMATAMVGGAVAGPCLIVLRQWLVYAMLVG